MKESQAEQARLSSYIHDLEDEKSTLQDANHRMVVENRELLQKLEQLNTDFGESGKRVHDLEDLLQNYEQEIRRLNNLTRRTQELEVKILDLERERCDMVKEVEDTRYESRSTIARWKESERKVRQLEQEVQKIEWAARMDREKHEEIVARMERDRNLERELGLSEGRLKATAAVQDMQKGGPQKQVVSNFVRDILQDNANLQAGVAELRELLQTSNDEIEQLREQVMLHQPLQDDDNTPIPQRTVSLSEELNLSQSLPQKSVQQEVHVHHHYHTGTPTKKEKTPLRRTSRRKAFKSYGHLSSSPASSGMSTPTRSQQRTTSPSNSISIRGSNQRTNRWSMQSTATASTYMSSIASSPTSYYDRNSSIFDRIDRDDESSRPTSPESFNVKSPMPFSRRDKNDDSALSVFEEENLDLDESISPLDTTMDTSLPADPDTLTAPQPNIPPEPDLTPKPSMILRHEEEHASLPVESPVPAELAEAPSSEFILESIPETEDRPDVLPSQPESVVQEKRRTSFSTEKEQEPKFGSRLRRSNSHESLLSISGMDIHLAQTSSRSTLALLQGHTLNKHHFAPTPASLRQTPISAAQPLASVTEYTAISRPGLEPATSASMLALNGIRSSSNRSDARPGLMGWVSSKWGRTPSSTKSIVDLKAVATSQVTPPRPSATHYPTSPIVRKTSVASSSPSTTSSNKRSISTNALEIPRSGKSGESSAAGSLSASTFLGRPPGINQSGPIPGFAAAIAAKKTPIVIHPPKVDLNGLQDSLVDQ